jgi:carboxymethylenebutenolidase
MAPGQSRGLRMDRSILDRIDQRVIALYDDFTHRHLDRRLFMARLSALVGAAAAAQMLPLLRSNYALAAQVKADDPRLEAGKLRASGAIYYRARPKGTERLPGVIVIHQNRGLNPHIEDVARRVALAGYVALAPDFLSGLGGTPEDEDEAMTRFTQLKTPDAVAFGLGAIAYLKAMQDAGPKIGVVGFCWGGGIVNRLAVSSPDLSAAVAFYGVAPPLDQVPNIKAKLLLHYAALDTRVGATRAPYEAALKKAGVEFTSYTYEGANHAFFDNTAGARYNEEAAKLAWQRTLAFFAATLKG